MRIFADFCGRALLVGVSPSALLPGYSKDIIIKAVPGYREGDKFSTQFEEWRYQGGFFIPNYQVPSYNSRLVILKFYFGNFKIPF